MFIEQLQGMDIREQVMYLQQQVRDMFVDVQRLDHHKGALLIDVERLEADTRVIIG